VSRWPAFLLGLTAGAFLGVRWAAHRAALITPPSFAPLLLSRLRRLYRDPARVVRLLNPRPEWTILDLGCGNGAFTFELARRVRRVVAVDVQPAMIDALEARIRDAGLGNVRARVAPATHLPFDDGVFDAALMISVLPMLHDRAAALAEVRRTLKPDGMLVIGEEWVEPEYVGERTTIGWVERAGFALLAREATALSYTLMFRPVPAHHQAYASGAGPPGPGKISSSFFNAASSSVIARARRLPVSCSVVRGPMIGAVTAFWRSSQANPTSAGCSPSFLQNRS
jgi:SAM-dependent methyltransferase